MTSRLPTIAGPEWGTYDRLVTDAISAFQEDVGYAIQVVESARTITGKKRNTAKQTKKKI